MKVVVNHDEKIIIYEKGFCLGPQNDADVGHPLHGHVILYEHLDDVPESSNFEYKCFSEYLYNIKKKNRNFVMHLPEEWVYYIT